MKTVPPLLSESPLFKGLDDDNLKQLLSIASEKSVNRNEIIFSEGDRATEFYIIIQGMVKVFKISMEGKEQILHIFGPGEPIGEVPVFSGELFPANASAMKPGRMLCFPRKGIIKLIKKNPDLAMNMLGIMAKRLRRFTVQVENLALKEVPARLAAYFLLLSEEQENRQYIELKISKGQLASFIGTTPETISRMLKKMGDMGLIAVEGHRIILMNSEGLSDLAEAGRI